MSNKRVFSVLGISALIGFQGCATDDGADGADGTGNLSSIEADVTLAAPLNLVVTVTSSVGESLAWDTPAGVTPDKYIIYRGFSPGTETTLTSAAASPTTFAYNHLTPATNYCWQVRYLVGSSLSPPSNEQCAATPVNTPPDAPADVTATAISSSRITVTWTAVAGATSYQVFQGSPPAAPSFLGTVAGSITTFQAAGLAAATTYAYQIRAVSANGPSELSTPAAVATTFLAGLEAYYKFDDSRAGTVAADSSGLGRNGTLSGGASFAGDKPPVFNDQSMLSVPAAADAKVTVPNTPAFNFTGAFSLATWVKLPTAADVHIVGMRTAGCGPLGWEIGQSAASGLYFAGRASTLASGTSLVVGAWTHVAVTSDGGNLTIYVNGAAVQSAPFVVGNALKLPLTLGHVGDCTGGAVKLDETTIYSRVLSADEVAKLGTVPPAPLNLTITSESSRHTVLSWSAVPGTFKYLVFRGTAAGGEVFLDSTDATGYDYGKQTPGVLYFWRVAAVVLPRVSPNSEEVSGATLPVPDAPANVTATALSGNRALVSWSAVTRAAQYQIFRSTGGGAFVFRSTVEPGTLTFRDAGLTAGTTYAYQVEAVDGDRVNSAASTTATITAMP